MKTKLNFLSKLIILSFVFASAAFSQSITNTLGTGGLFTIKDASTNFLTLNQSTGQVNILKTLRLENTTSSSVGIIFKGATRFLHNFGTANTFIGSNSGNFTMTGGGNTAVGVSTLLFNTTGTSNTSLGGSSLQSNTTGNNNTAVGGASLISNTTGSNNTSMGPGSLQFNTIGGDNTALGYRALITNESGSFNTAVGDGALEFVTGNNNTAIGYATDVPDTKADNQVRIGNTDVTYAGVQVAWTITSDRRWKSNILNSNLGLNFISKLRPVSYTRNNDVKQKTEYGFIAQEIVDVLKESGVDNSGMITIDDKGRYELRYNDLLAPMVQSIQDLKAENDELKKEVEQLKTVNEKIVKLEQIVNELTSVRHTSLTGKEVNLTNSK